MLRRMRRLGFSLMTVGLSVLFVSFGSVAHAAPLNRNTVDQGALQQSAAETVYMYRLYNTSTRDHFYTADWLEASYAFTNLGYSYEGVLGMVMPADSADGVPLHRLYNPHTGDHFYTTDASEAIAAANHSGYRYERIEARVWSSAASGGRRALHRFYATSTGDHFYTANLAEVQGAPSGYSYEGIIGYVQ